MPLLMAALVSGISSVRRMFWPFQKAVSVSEIRTPCREAASAGFLKSPASSTYSAALPSPWM